MGRELEIVDQELDDAKAELARLVAMDPVTTALDQSWQIDFDAAEEAVRLLVKKRAALLDAQDIADRQIAAARTAAEERIADDERTFWFRRFMTTLGIANAASFAALASGFLQAERQQHIAAAVGDAMAIFAGGMVAAGLVPLLLWGQANIPNPRDGRRSAMSALGIGLTIVSALLFTYGLAVSIGAVRGLAG